MATTSIRWVVAKRLVEVFAADARMSGVAVHPTWPGDKNVTAEMVWIGPLEGDVTREVMTGSRLWRDDIFTAPIRARVAIGASTDDAMTRLSEIVGTVDDVLASNAGLSNLDGVISAVVIFEGLTPAQTPEGLFAFAEMTLQIHTRLN